MTAEGTEENKHRRPVVLVANRRDSQSCAPE